MAFDTARIINEQLIVVCRCDPKFGVQPGVVVQCRFTLLRDNYMLTVRCNACGAYHDKQYSEAKLLAMFLVHNKVIQGSIGSLAKQPKPSYTYSYDKDVGVINKEGERESSTVDQPMTPRERHEWFCNEMRKDF